MKLARGDMWSALRDADLFCITTNAQTRADGALVMGRGIALEAKERYPKLPFEAGLTLQARKAVGGKYGLITLPHGPHPRIRFGLFQVKYHWKDEADPALIANAVTDLTGWCLGWRIEAGEWPRVHLNFPGIGNGRLKREDILPLIEVLPDCVTVWEKG